jgi:glutamate synthase (NADPH/NADH) small chain
VKSFGVEVRTNMEVGRDISTADLLSQYDAVFLGVGLGADSRLAIPGEDGAGVYGATAWIEEMKLSSSAPSPRGKRVLVVGGGNTAIDVARECAQLGAIDVVMVYRRTIAEMSGYAHELEGARKEGVRLIDSAVPVEILRDASGALIALRIATADKGKPVPGTERELHCDMIAIAIGQSKLREIATSMAGVTLDDRGCIIADPDTCQTGNPKVFAGGDAINGGKEVVNAVADGRNAARTLLARFAKA